MSPKKKKKPREKPKNKAGIKWAMIRRHYIAGVKPAKLVRLYKLNYAALESRIRRGKWGKIRKETARKATGKMIDIMARDDAKTIRLVKTAEREKIENLRKLVDQTMLAKLDGRVRFDGKGKPILKDLSPKDMKDVVYAHKVLQQMTYISFGIPTVVVGERPDSDKTFAQLVQGWEEENADE